MAGKSFHTCVRSMFYQHIRTEVSVEKYVEAVVKRDYTKFVNLYFNFMLFNYISEDNILRRLINSFS